MNKLLLVNKILFVAVVFLLLLFVVKSLKKQNGIVTGGLNNNVYSLPDNLYGFSESTYANMIDRVFFLKNNFSELPMPNIKDDIIFYGINRRPDRFQDRLQLSFGVKGTSYIITVYEGERFYLAFEDGNYVFSNESQATFWLEASFNGDKASVDMGMNASSSTDALTVSCEIPVLEYNQSGWRKWDIGEYRADQGVLARQHLRWFGQDLFLKNHGGSEYSDFTNLERLDFDNGEKAYSVFIGKESALIWRDGRWCNEKIGAATEDYPLLVFESVVDNMMKLNLWDISGTIEIPISIVKMREPWSSIDFEKELKFMGAQTRNKAIVEACGERLTLKPFDWVLRNHLGEWNKITSEIQIDQYVEREISGELLIVEGIVRQDGYQFLRGKIYNTSRTKCTDVNLPLQSMVQIEKGKSKLQG